MGIRVWVFVDSVARQTDKQFTRTRSTDPHFFGAESVSATKTVTHKKGCPRPVNAGFCFYIPTDIRLLKFIKPLKNCLIY
jgi:hypothetical protein